MAANMTEADRAPHTPAGAFTSILTAAVGFAAGKLERKVAAVTDKLQGVADPSAASGSLGALADEGLDELAEGGAANKAGAEGIRAGLHGKNPVLAAVGGAWQSGTPVVRAAIITTAASAVLLLILTPVLGVIFLASLLLLAAVERARSATP